MTTMMDTAVEAEVGLRVMMTMRMAWVSMMMTTMMSSAMMKSHLTMMISVSSISQRSSVESFGV